MNSVTTLTRSVDSDLIRKLFIKFSNSYGHLWSSRHKDDDEWLECIHIWLEELRKFDFVVIQKSLRECFSAFKEYPPTLMQFVDICLRISGVPSEEDVASCLIRRDFKHPLIKMIFDKMDTWALRQAKPDELKSKIRSLYGNCLTAYRGNPDRAWGLLQDYKAQLALPAAPSKIPSGDEILGFRDRMKLYQEKSKADKLRLGAKFHPEWPAVQVTPGCNGFDEKLFNERKKYLMELDETMASTLSHDDIYDRIRFLRESEASQQLKKVGYAVSYPPPDKTPPRGSFWTKKVYKTWGGD